jgi:ectoine hydroxylase-related dioxygenase (phytanoyl-CoA dioxygenase family)
MNHTQSTADGAAPASDAQVRQYWDDGVLVVRNLFSARDVAGWRDEVERLFSMAGMTDPLNLRVEARAHGALGRIADRLDPVLDISAVFRQLVHDRRLHALLAAIFGAPANILRCKLIRKITGTAGYAMHQDYPYWEWLNVPADDLLTVAVAIDDVNEACGGIEYFLGQHDRRQAPHPLDALDVDESGMDLSRNYLPMLKAGDVAIFHSLTPHRSAMNASGLSRALLLPTFSHQRHGSLYRRYHEGYIAKKLAHFRPDAGVLRTPLSAA